MFAIIKKYKKRILDGIALYKYEKSFDKKVARMDLYSSFFRRQSKINEKIHYSKHERVKKILKNEYKDYINELNKNYNISSGVISDYKNIFIMWYQGIENAPILVKKCVNRIKELYSDYKIYIIDNTNIRTITNLPDRIFYLLEKKEITFTFLSDLVRFNVLDSYGGIWIDSTCYLENKIEVNHLQYFSINHNLFSKWHVCKGKWSGFFIGSTKGNPFIKWVYLFMLNFMMNHEHIPCYFFIDCSMAIAYETNELIRDMVDLVPINNTRVFALEKILDQKYDSIMYNSLLEDTKIFKLTYKRNYNFTLKDSYYEILLGKY